MKPAAPLAGAFVACALLAGAALAGLAGVDALAAAAAVVVLAASVDAAMLRALPVPAVRREAPSVVPVGLECVVAIALRNAGRRAVAARVHDLHPGDWPVDGLPRDVVVPPGRELRLEYRLTPVERGTFAFAGCELALRSPLGLWTRKATVDAPHTLRVFPNFAPLAPLALVGAEQASRVVGAHLHRRRGEGTEFQQLREYRTGDSLRQIDWKASARVHKLISRDYQDERNQQVMVVLDTGRRMLARDGTLAHFDHVLNAVLLLAYIALRRGDAVGLLATGGDARFMPARRGLGAINLLLDTVYDLQPRPVATDYLEAATQLGAGQPRRSLVLFVTNVRDEDIDDLVVAAHQLQRRHLVCVASLREQAIDDALAKRVETLDDAVGVAALSRYLEDRAKAHRALRARGVPLLDVTAAELPGALVEHYLAVKRAAAL